MRFVVFDTETTGHAGSDQVIEIGAVEIVGGKLGKRFQQYIKPTVRIHQEAFKVHGISAQKLVGMPGFAEAAPAFFEFIRGATLVAHNATFDIRMLKGDCQRCGLDVPVELDVDRVIDTMKLAKERWPGQRISLDAILTKLGIDNRHRKLHGALLDSELLAEAFLEMRRGQNKLSLDGAAASKEIAPAGTRVVGALPKIVLTSDSVHRHNTYMTSVAKNPAAVLSSPVGADPAPSPSLLVSVNELDIRL